MLINLGNYIYFYFLIAIKLNCKKNINIRFKFHFCNKYFNFYSILLKNEEKVVNFTDKYVKGTR